MQSPLPTIPRLRGQPWRFSLFRQLTDYRWQEIREFVQLSRDGMEMAWEKFTKDFDSKVAGWTKSRVAQYVDTIYDDIASLRDSTPVLMRQSHCLIVFGAFEHSVADICWSIHRDKKIADPPPKDLYTWKARRYLEGRIGTRPLPFADDWSWLSDFRIIRNWIAHNAAKVDKSSKPDEMKRAQKFLNRNRGMIKFGHHGEIRIEDALVDRAIKRAQAAIARIEKACDKLY